MDGVTGAAWPLDSLSGVCGKERPYSLLSQVCSWHEADQLHGALGRPLMTQSGLCRLECRTGAVNIRFGYPVNVDKSLLLGPL
jgi:hypothetical protein